MTRNRWAEFWNNDDAQLTDAEIAEGWHFCWEWDGLLVGPGMDELDCCHCLTENHPAYAERERGKK